jgi:2-dehydro-3-deoxyglucarate aldolase/4-hydroxy-2-oxoheptanedioate aldolase
MNPSSFIQRLRSRERCLFGTWVKLPTHETLEMLARAGFDYVVLDAEHAPLTLETIYRLMAHAQALGMAALVRVPDQATNDFQRLLDCGADGLLIPRVRNAAEARRVIGRMVFSPRGERGMGATSRAGLWGTVPVADYVRRGNEDILRCPQLEDREVLQDPGQILDVEGVNAVFIGMGDLSMTTGLPASHPELQALVDRLLAACRERQVPCGAAAGDAAAALAAARRGFAFVMVSNDATLFARAAAGVMQQVRAG